MMNCCPLVKQLIRTSPNQQDYNKPLNHIDRNKSDVVSHYNNDRLQTFLATLKN